ncbi:chlorophyll A-B binding protein [Aureococcus anophagefferens]|nr:chlorophyll A-B binding protein [Aureococcus anophagefferens]
MQKLIVALACSSASAFVAPHASVKAVLKSDPVDEIPKVEESRYGSTAISRSVCPAACRPWASGTPRASPSTPATTTSAATARPRRSTAASPCSRCSASSSPSRSTRFFADVKGPAIDHLTQVRKEYPAFFEIGALAIGGLEVNRALQGWAFPENRAAVGQLNEDYYPGDVGFDPLGLKPTDPAEFNEMATKELQNGRLAMLAAAGFIEQELVNHKPILETLRLLLLLNESEMDKEFGLNLPSGDIATIERELETGAADTFFK